MEETDENIYSRFLKNRNESDLRILLERHREGLLFFLYGQVHNMEDAEELLIDSFASVASGRTVFMGRSSFKTWLFAVAQNKARMFMRQNRPETVSIEDIGDVIPDQDNNIEDIFLNNEQNKELYYAMYKLEPEVRNVLYLIYFEDMSYEDVAKVTGKTRRQIYGFAKHCREKLKKILEGGGINEKY